MIKINTLGRISAGDDQGKYVKIQELLDDPPSFLVLTAADPDFTHEGGDEWVEDFASLQQFFEEARWVIDWEPRPDDDDQWHGGSASDH
ncbi:hypothetical protein [Streptomyces sp. MST-110588]|uniref:hypothetical protein n=1 Tax=Streptomyces sp. MST-110588 TaxID=2833628 RepID=UPI001F5D0C1B|nr:hypothetical protein [Streptomyces sp. MST-110588]UNO41077.1 hypothetical protein KGS77_17655 [Streptomyces sp. MST-110588]